MNAMLVLVKSDGSMREVPVRRERLLIGREKKCDVRIAVPEVSREHAEVRVEQEQVLIRDMGSSNGTYVNRNRVQQTELKAGDLVAIGPAVFVVRVDGEPVAIDAAGAFSDGAGPKPVASSPGGGGKRPSAPGAAKAASKKKAPPTPKDDDDDFDLGGDASGESSITDFDFDFLDEDEDEKKQPKL